MVPACRNLVFAEPDSDIPINQSLYSQMKNNLVICITLAGLLCGSKAIANDSAGAEFSHFAGNAALASATTVIVHKFAPKVKRPALTGFIVSASEIVVGEGLDHMNGGDFSFLDVAVGTLGAAVGAYATDKWYVQPKVVTAKKETTYGVMVSRRF